MRRDSQSTKSEVRRDEAKAQKEPKERCNEEDRHIVFEVFIACLVVLVLSCGDKSKKDTADGRQGKDELNPRCDAIAKAQTASKTKDKVSLFPVNQLGNCGYINDPMACAIVI